MPRILTFELALEHAHDHCDDNLAVLLGNGFSMDYDATIFGYDSLAEEAALSGLSLPKARLFSKLGSRNFETIVEKLKSAADLNVLYGGEADITKRLRRDAKVVRNGLADVLVTRHPDSASEVSDEQVGFAKAFLANFQRVFTLSYDLLLYWVVNRSEVQPHAPTRDGFEYPEWNVRPKLIWKSQPTQGTQEVFYLHGALHYFVESVEGLEGKRLVKLHTMSRLVGGLRQRFNLGQYPVVVTEGQTAEKVSRIEKSPYLRNALGRFGASKGAVFVHGVSMSHNDDHIWDALEQDTSEVTALYVAIHGNPTSELNLRLIERAELIKQRRTEAGGQRLRLKFYDSDSAHVWR